MSHSSILLCTIGTGNIDQLRETLEQEGLVRTTVRGSGKQRTYSFEVVESLPLLSPEQVARLPAPLQAAHERFLDRAVLRERPEQPWASAPGPSP